jgi:hypothetical protein
MLPHGDAERLASYSGSSDLSRFFEKNRERVNLLKQPVFCRLRAGIEGNGSLQGVIACSPRALSYATVMKRPLDAGTFAVSAPSRATSKAIAGIVSSCYSGRLTLSANH